HGVFCFFQAEDGIRVRNVTGVQTCALPIFFLQECPAKSGGVFVILADFPPFVKTGTYRYAPLLPGRTGRRGALSFFRIERQTPRSEERRAGKEGTTECDMDGVNITHRNP